MGESFDFELILVGRAIESVPFFILAFRKAAEDGIGLNRARCDLRGVVTGDRVLWDEKGFRHESAVRAAAADWINSRLAKLELRNESALKIRFRTPTFLTSQGQPVRAPAFHHLLKRARDRISALAAFFGEQPLEADFQGLGSRAESVKTICTSVEWIDRTRTSSRTGQRHPLSGFVGDTTFAAVPADFLPWLPLAELTHVGKHSSWGNGWIEMSTAS